MKDSTASTDANEGNNGKSGIYAYDSGERQREEQIWDV